MSGSGSRHAVYVVTVTLSAPDFMTQMNRWVADGAAWIPGPQEGLTPLRNVTLQVDVAGKRVGAVPGRAVQVTPSGVGIEFADRDAILTLTRGWDSSLESGDEGEAAPPEPEATNDEGSSEDVSKGSAPNEEAEAPSEDQEAPTQDEPVEGASEEETTQEPPKTDGMGSLYHRLKVLTVLEKKHLALRANKAERHMLSRDNNKGLHVFVLRNPNVSAAEAASFLKFPRYSVNAIRMIADTPEWVSNIMVQRNIICHPATPLEISRKLLSRMNESQLRMLQRTGRLNAMLAKDAKQRLVRLREKTKKRR